jgi:two-component system cell cycle response regulator
MDEQTRQDPQDHPNQGHVVVTDDSLTVRMMLKSHLEGAGYRVSVFADGEACAAHMGSGEPAPDLVLLDVVMPGMDGLEVLRLIKGNDRLGYVPVILLTARGEVSDRVEGLNLGADDYIAKPFESDELLARVRAHIRIKRLQDALSAQNQALEAANQEKAVLLDQLEAKNAQLAELAKTDPLTGIANRGHIESCLGDEVARAQRFKHPLSVAMLDIDHFKQINDGFGHPFGDRAIREIARVLADTLRQVDKVGRYGGEEFLMVLPDTDLAGARIVAERIRQIVAGTVFQPENHQATVSIGLAQWDPALESWEALVSRADKALYEAKETGRNRVCCWDGEGTGVTP